jgi:hypothetical protein
LPSVFAIKVRTQFISRADARLLLRQFREDIATRKFDVFAVGESEFAQAERLVEQYAFDLRLRALDAVRLAVALGLSRLCEVAAIERFSVLNPEQP